MPLTNKINAKRKTSELFKAFHLGNTNQNGYIHMYIKQVLMHVMYKMLQLNSAKLFL